MLTANELLAGASLTYTASIPEAVLYPGGRDDNGNGTGEEQTVLLRPLTVNDLQLVTRAARENDTLTATLMVQRALVEPEMTIAQVATMHAGLVQYLLEKVNQISGITVTSDELDEASQLPLTKAAFVLAQAYGWTPDEVSQLTLGQVMLQLKMLRENGVTHE